MSRSRIHRSEQGFSLLELLVVVIIIGIMMGMGWANYRDFRANVAARGFATSILAKMREAKNMAQSLTKNVTLKLDMDNETAWLEVDGVQMGATLAAPENTNVALLGLEDQTGNSVFTTGTFSIVFTPRNTADGKSPLTGFATVLHVGVKDGAGDDSYSSGKSNLGFKTILVTQTGGRAELFGEGCFYEDAIGTAWGWPDCSSL